ncbi:helix-turn-helix domain-containing protein [Flavobacterium sp. HJSW_4]|uniref:helix-turn-helix domain-containing protein n=1 Tax=Flavobacterium sp. HJSW_4 TaxID=3344660 RepID=UPI0035F27D42
MFRTTLAFLQLPVFYLYAVSVCYSDFRIRPKYILHLLPFIVSNLILLPRFYLVDAAAKMDFILNRKTMIEMPFNHILIHIQIFAYFAAVFMLLKRAKKLYLENFAGASINSYNWLFQFTAVLGILYSVTLFKNIFKFSDYDDVFEWFKIGIILFQLFISCWYLYKALNHPGLFRNIDSNLKLVSDIVSEERNGSIVAADKQCNEELVKLKRYMAEEKPFLNPSLTIQDVSAALEIPVRDLSLLINHKLEQHFYDFVNTYRIENAMDILKDAAKSKVTILEILYEVGFNSKSSFNTAFKKHTGKTPTYYRKGL